MVLELIVNNIEFFVFSLLLTLFLVFKRKNIQIQGYFPVFYLILYKTRLGLDKMSSWSSKQPKIFLGLSYLSIFVGIFGLFASFFFMIWQLKYILDFNITQGGGLVLPIKTASGTIAGIPVVAPPFFEWIIALMVLVIVHEFAHGVISERFKIRVKSSGFAFGGLFLPLLPAAFVEPDEKQLKKASWWKQIAVFGAGSTSNFIFGFLFYLVFIFVALPLTSATMQVNEISFNSVLNESDLNNYNITSGNITKFNGVEVSELDFVIFNGVGPGMSDRTFLFSFLNLSVNESISLTIDDGKDINTYDINTFENPSVNNSGMIGISGYEPKIENNGEYVYIGNFPIFFQRLIYWIILLNIGIGIMNLLPLWITDGGQIARTLLVKTIKNKDLAFRILNIVSYMTLLLIVFLLFPNLLRSIFSLF
ncbi:MAG: site-2 protease family protein [Candidatus Woesearchaeota archaeon]|jgi:membrane-associated protease RseP (regulator of RpoE activity)|nr:site-2 protease family protein [Candidatus Woesearchaeota archaeon]